MTPDGLLNDTLRAHLRGRALSEVMAAALKSVDPRGAVRSALRVDRASILVGGKRYNIHPHSRIFVVGGGKAGAPMAEAACEVLGDRVRGGVVVVKDGHLGDLGSRLGHVKLYEAGHPVPDQRGVAASGRLADLLSEATKDDLIIALISGGGSALLTLPAPGLLLPEIQTLTSELLRCGATINEINTVRKHCLRIAGGGLAALAAPARVASLIISDVVGSPFDVIASGPTAPDPSTFADAWAVIQNHRLEDVLPSAVTSHLRRGMDGELAATPKPDAPLWRRVYNNLVASNLTASEAAVAAARERGFEATLLTTFLEGEAREVGRAFASIARELVRRRASRERPILFVAGGETTVTLRGRGQGGRNQELALAAVHGLAGLPGVLMATLATDGGDGPTDAAGATVTGGTLELARARGIDPDEFLQRNDSYNFFAPLGALLRPGPTLTNVNDLLFLLVDT